MDKDLASAFSPSETICDLRQANDPVGLQCDRYLKKAIKSADRVVVA
jgi:hypothetical protein